MPITLSFYLDENVSKEIAYGLRTRNIDVITTHEIDHKGYKDEEHLACALVERRVFVTQDEDFLRLNSKQIPHAGIVYYKQRTKSDKAVIRYLIQMYDRLDAEDMMNQVVYLKPES